MENDNKVWNFEIKIRFGGNGILDYAKIDIQSLDQADKEQIKLLKKIKRAVDKYNQWQIDHA